MGRGVKVMLLRATGAVVMFAATAPAAATPAAAPVPCPPRSAGAALAGTTPEDVEALVRAFARAYNRGDAARLDPIFAAEPDFEWYSVDDERFSPVAEDRTTLMPYFESRHRLGDRIRILAVTVREEPSWHGGYDFSFELRRRSDAPGATGRYHGKGAASCSIFVWSMGADD